MNNIKKGRGKKTFSHLKRGKTTISKGVGTNDLTIHSAALKRSVIFFFIDPNLTWRNEFFKESLQIFPKSL
jgi:hypothetical protein